MTYGITACEDDAEEDTKSNNTRYYDTNRVIYEGELVVTTRNPAGSINRLCSSVSRKRYILAGVLVTVDGKLCAMDVTEKQDLESFVDGVAFVSIFNPAMGIVYKLSKKKARGLKRSYKKASINMEVDKVSLLLDKVGMKIID